MEQASKDGRERRDRRRRVSGDNVVACIANKKGRLNILQHMSGDFGPAGSYSTAKRGSQVSGLRKPLVSVPKQVMFSNEGVYVAKHQGWRTSWKPEVLSGLQLRRSRGLGAQKIGRGTFRTTYAYIERDAFTTSRTIEN